MFPQQCFLVCPGLYDDGGDDDGSDDGIGDDSGDDDDNGGK
jgi:hypothetical protein